MLDIECHDQIRVMLSPDAQLLASEIYGFPVVLERSGNRRDSKDPRVGFPEDHRPSSEPLIAVTIQEEAPHRTGLAREYRNRRLLDEGRGKTLPRCSPTPPFGVRIPEDKSLLAQFDAVATHLDRKFRTSDSKFQRQDDRIDLRQCTGSGLLRSPPLTSSASSASRANRYAKSRQEMIPRSSPRPPPSSRGITSRTGPLKEGNRTLVREGRNHQPGLSTNDPSRASKGRVGGPPAW